ncbi:hypothetical protein KY359_04530 [Candidatus Woesearchaeota archaeon]|nr:hypothetical protein [Candidatus Woesearchaeota archaeon]
MDKGYERPYLTQEFAPRNTGVNEEKNNPRKCSPRALYLLPDGTVSTARFGPQDLDKRYFRR